ncbi:TetR/AcrR family transcriptional regulator [Ideonella sp. DXS22W]|uniref:TetR/AcrR family transcriptional regulator n=1 Tax=Pseudaquabacterium inlustre TaxID=2984192 RepID=A0ABU9CML4_9BURK
MKTSKAQQDETRARIVRTAVALMSERGFDAVTMKDIAWAASVGDATIYKYFPSKERLVLGYFDLVAADAVKATRATPGFADYALQDRLQRLTDAILERLEPERAFVLQARALLARAPLLLLGDQLQAKQTLRDQVLADLQHAVATGEIAPSDFLQLLSGLYGDYAVGVVGWWLHDRSPGAADTPRFVDQTLGILVAALKSGLPDRLVQLALFFVRSQMARVMQARADAGPAAPAPEPAAAPDAAEPAGAKPKPAKPARRRTASKTARTTPTRKPA